jgi:hypothetical protein
MLTLLAVAALLPGQAPQAGRFDLSERVKAFDVAWVASENVEKRREALDPLKRAQAYIVERQYSEACKWLDVARAKLLDAEVRPGDALSLKFDPPFCEPGGKARLLVSWAYDPGSTVPVQLAWGRRRVAVLPGRSLSVEVDPAASNPDVGLNAEVGYAVPFDVDGHPETAYLSLVKNARKRIEALAASRHAVARSLGAELREALSDQARTECDIALLDWLDIGERLASGRSQARELEDIPFAIQGKTEFRASFPSHLSGSPAAGITVVVAHHAEGAAESWFFDACGRGRAVKEALRRGWAFVAMRSANGSTSDAVSWIERERGVKVARLFVLGHGLGAAAALTKTGSAEAPHAAALLAPALAALPGGAERIPTFLAVGREDAASIVAFCQAVARENAGREDFRYEEFDACEHLAIVADAVESAYRFFDRIAVVGTPRAKR